MDLLHVHINQLNRCLILLLHTNGDSPIKKAFKDIFQVKV